MSRDLMDFIGFIVNNPETGKKLAKETIKEKEQRERSREASERVQKSLEALRKKRK